MGPPQPMDLGASFTQQPIMGQGPSYPSRSGYDTQRIEELAEAIIDEKWNEIVRSINKIIDWKERVESRVTKMEQQMDDLQKNFDRLHNGVLGKITDYDQNLQNVGAEIKAMDRVFQKVLPTLTDNVSELSNIAKRLKK
jgi:Mg2+ and Co2+ transporter CorA